MRKSNQAQTEKTSISLKILTEIENKTFDQLDELDQLIIQACKEFIKNYNSSSDNLIFPNPSSSGLFQKVNQGYLRDCIKIKVPSNYKTENERQEFIGAIKSRLKTHYGWAHSSFENFYVQPKNVDTADWKKQNTATWSSKGNTFKAQVIPPAEEVDTIVIIKTTAGRLCQHLQKPIMELIVAEKANTTVVTQGRKRSATDAMLDESQHQQQEMIAAPKLPSLTPTLKRRILEKSREQSISTPLQQQQELGSTSEEQDRPSTNLNSSTSSILNSLTPISRTTTPSPVFKLSLTEQLKLKQAELARLAEEKKIKEEKHRQAVEEAKQQMKQLKELEQQEQKMREELTQTESDPEERALQELQREEAASQQQQKF